MKQILISFILLTSVFTFAQPSEKADEMRGVWIVRHNMASEQSIDKLIKVAEEMQFTDLFVQVRGRGDAYYNSKIEPKAEGLAPNFDPLAYLLEKVADKPFRIHVWLNALYFWSAEKQPDSPDHLFHTKPDWIVQPYHFDSTATDPLKKNLRNPEGLYHSPVNDEVKTYLLTVIKDVLTNYDVDGLHLDYIRYPGREYGFNEDARERFKNRHFIDPLTLKKNPEVFIDNHGQTGYELHYSRWATFLRDELSLIVKDIAHYMRKSHPGVKLSAAVKPELKKAHWEFFQDWDRWVNAGWLDFAVAMNYTPHNTTFLRRSREMLAAVNKSRLIMGVSLYNQSTEAAMQKVRQFRELSTTGFTLFSYDSILEDASFKQRFHRAALQSVGK